MNTYFKYAPNVYLAKCEGEHERGEIIQVTTKHGKENDCVVHNRIGTRDGFFFYSITRVDGLNAQTYAQKRIDKLNGYAESAKEKSDSFYEKSNEHKDFLSLAEPIKVGHHSEGRHRKIIERANNNMSKCVEFSNKADSYASRIEYWEGRKDEVNLSMPESIEFYQFKLEQARDKHAKIKSGEIAKAHSYSLTYAKKEVNEAEKNLALAIKLWAQPEEAVA